MGTLLKMTFITATLMMAFTACVRDNTDHCKKSCDLTIAITDAEGNDITSKADIGDVDLYLFCGRGDFLDKITVPAANIRAGKSIRFDYGDYDRVTAVAWANVNCPNIDMVEVGPGTNLSSQLHIALRDHSEEDTEHRSPKELHHGSRQIKTQQGLGTFREKLAVRSTVGRINVITKHLRRWADCDEWERFSFVVYGTRDRLAFANSRPEGSPAVYKPALDLDPGISTASAVLTTFPSSEEPIIELRIYKDAELIYSVSEFDDGTPFWVHAGGELDIHVSFATGGKVHVTVEPWDEGGQHTEF